MGHNFAPTLINLGIVGNLGRVMRKGKAVERKRETAKPLIISW